MSGVVTKVRRALGLETELESFKRELDGDREAVTALTQEEHAILLAEPVQADVAPLARQFCLARRATLREQVGREIGHTTGGRLMWTAGARDVAVVPGAFPELVLSLSAFDVLLLRDLDAAVALIVSLAAPTGLTVQQKLQRLGEIAQEREAIRSRHAQKVDGALELGIRADHLAETVSLRAAEQQARARLEHEEADRQQHLRLTGH